MNNLGRTFKLNINFCIFHSIDASLPILFPMCHIIGDIMIAVLSMSTEIFWEMIGEGPYGNITCKISTYIQCLLFVGTSFILVSMSFDRYEAICKPLAFSRSTQRSRKIILLSFFLAALVAIPQLFIFMQVFSDIIVHRCSQLGLTSKYHDRH